MGNSHVLAGPESRKEEGIMQSDIEQSEHFLKSQSSTAAIPNLLGGLTEPLIIWWKLWLLSPEKKKMHIKINSLHVPRSKPKYPWSTITGWMVIFHYKHLRVKFPRISGLSIGNVNKQMNAACWHMHFQSNYILDFNVWVTWVHLKSHSKNFSV